MSATVFAAPSPPPEVDYSIPGDWQKKEAEYIEMLRALARDEVDVIGNADEDLVGEIVRWQRADGYASYMVWTTKPLRLVHLDLGDGYQVEAALIRGLTVAEVRRMVEWERSWVKATTEPNESFYGSITVHDDIVHYHNGFGQFVRCRVVKDEDGIGGVKLLPVALIGEIGRRQEPDGRWIHGWSQSDIVRRMPDGTPYYGHYPKMILEGERFQPHASNIYEYEGFNDRAGIDPRDMDAISLELPPMTDEEERIAPLAKAYGVIQALVNDRPSDAKGYLGVFNKIGVVIDRAEKEAYPE